MANAASAQTQSNNYVITQAPRIAGITNDSLMAAKNTDKSNVQITIQYVDGLGRPIQTIQKQASPRGFDMIQPQAYDQYGREVTKYLPYTPQTGTAGSFRSSAITDQGAFYSSPPSNSGVSAITDPYAQTAFDNSPLNRTVEQGAPGPDWQLGSHTVKMVYTLNNDTTFATDSIKGRRAAMYYTTIGTNLAQTLHANGYYPAGSLTVTISKDENWTSGRAGTVEEYKDIDGKVVLKRVYNYAAGAVQQLSTYYVYDDFGRLAMVLPPASGADGAGAINSTTLNNYCYQYWYDERGRPILKRLPGKGKEYVIYNTMDQPVATQDSLQRAANIWLFTKYDALGRVVMTGEWNHGGTAVSRSTLQNTLNGISSNLYESSIATGNGYTNVAWPTSSVTATLSINYYDSYTNAPGLPGTYSAPSGANMSTRGQLTATKTAVLNTPTDMLWTAHYYDTWGRSLEGYAQHYLGGTTSTNNFDAVSTTYDFTNTPTTVTRNHWTSASTTYPLVKVYNRYFYDWMSRKQNSWEQLTNTSLAADTMRLVSNTAYNEVGQLRTKKLHSTDSVNYLQTIFYTYNERGWLRIDSSKLFAMRLDYNTGTNKQYNGNIAYQYWGVPRNLNNHYTYTYDKLNRLNSGITSLDNYQESGISYDLMGNITALNRYQAGTQVDQLTYTYTGNQLQSVADANASNSGLVSGTTNYTWDGNGNMLSAANTVNTAQNKSFTYNLLNLPLVVTIPNGTATYTYDATGNKLRKVSALTSGTTTTDYVSGIQYKNSTIDFIQTEEGKAVPNGTTNYDYIYYLGDNLGNTRVTFGTKTGAAVSYQKDDYYPFGLEIIRTPGNPQNEYLYNKKELQEELSEYDYGARYYDPVIGRWNTMDRLAEKYRPWSPYTYVANNPTKNIDPNGMDYQNGIYENGLYGNTVTYLAGDESSIVQAKPTVSDPTQSLANQPAGNYSEPETIVITYHNGTDYVTSTIITHYLEDNSDGTQTERTVTTTTTAAVDAQGNIAKQVTQSILRSSVRQRRADEDRPTIYVGDIKYEKPITNHLDFNPNQDLNNITSRLSEFKQNYHISPLVQIADFNKQRSGIYGWVGTGISAVGLAVLYLNPESRILNIIAGGSATAGFYMDIYIKFLGTDPENMNLRIK